VLLEKPLFDSIRASQNLPFIHWQNVVGQMWRQYIQPGYVLDSYISSPTSGLRPA
jgi:hypothetical protein